jgi:hypothetical protein
MAGSWGWSELQGLPPADNGMRLSPIALLRFDWLHRLWREAAWPSPAGPKELQGLLRAQADDLLVTGNKCAKRSSKAR